MSDDFDHDEVFKVAGIIGSIVFFPALLGLVLILF